MEVVFLQLSIIFGASGCAYIYSKGSTANQTIFFLLLSFLILFIPAALRGDMGTDYASYIDIYYKAIDRDWYVMNHIELLYVNLCLALGFFGFPAQSHIAVIAFLTYFFIYLATPRKHLPIVILIYTATIYFSTWHVIRQTLAISIAYYATTLLIKNKYIAAFIFVFIAMGFHNIASLYLPIFLLFIFVKLPPKQILYVSVLFFIIATVVTIEMILGESAKYLYVVEKHLNNHQATQLDIKGSGLGLLTIFIFFIPILLSLSSVIKKNDSILKNVLLWIIPLNIIAIIYASQAALFARLQMNFTIYLLLLSIFLYSTKWKYNKIVLFALSLFFVVSVAYKSYSYELKGLTVHGSQHYRFFWENKNRY